MLEKARSRKAPGGTWCTTPAPPAAALARSAAPRSTSSGTFPNPTGVRSRTIPDSSVSTGGIFYGESHKVIARPLTDEAKVEPIGTATSPQRRRERRGSAEKSKRKLEGKSRIRVLRRGGRGGVERAEEEESRQGEACQSRSEEHTSELQSLRHLV